MVGDIFQHFRTNSCVFVCWFVCVRPSSTLKGFVRFLKHPPPLLNFGNPLKDHIRLGELPFEEFNWKVLCWEREGDRERQNEFNSEPAPGGLHWGRAGRSNASRRLSNTLTKEPQMLAGDGMRIQREMRLFKPVNP